MSTNDIEETLPFDRNAFTEDLIQLQIKHNILFLTYNPRAVTDNKIPITEDSIRKEWHSNKIQVW